VQKISTDRWSRRFSAWMEIFMFLQA